jgi:hypothetical protein
VPGLDGRPIAWTDIEGLFGGLLANKVMGDRAMGELMMHQIQAIEEASYQSSRAASRLERLTLWLVALTIVIAILTLATVALTIALFVTG